MIGVIERNNFHFFLFCRFTFPLVIVGLGCLTSSITFRWNVFPYWLTFRLFYFSRWLVTNLNKRCFISFSSWRVFYPGRGVFFFFLWSKIPPSPSSALLQLSPPNCGGQRSRHSVSGGRTFSWQKNTLKNEWQEASHPSKKNQVPFKQQDSSSRQTGLGIKFRFDSHPHRIGMLLCPEGISPLSI